MIRKDKKIRDVVISLTVIVLLVASLFIISQNLLKSNETNKQIEKLQTELDDLEMKRGELQATLDMPMDEEYVASIAKSQLGLRYPQEQIYYSNKSTD